MSAVFPAPVVSQVYDVPGYYKRSIRRHGVELTSLITLGIS